MLHSNTVRVPQDMETLKQHGHSIGILSLQGSLFFGNTDYLSRRIAEITATASMLVLDFQRITDIDTSACMVLDRVDKNLRRKGITIFFGGIKPGDDIHQLLLEMDINSVINKGFMYPDLNNALSEAEDKILEIYGESGDPNRELKLSETIIFDGFSESEFELMDMQRREFNKDEIIIKEGTVADGFFVLVKGRVSIYKEDDSGGMELVDFGAGVSIGEMAVLASTTRTASVVASSDAVLYFISAKKLQALRESHPIVSERIVMNLASSLSRRLASASETIHMLQKT
jgi:SulP family sulfate permease